MKIKKSQRKIITIILLVLIIFSVLYIFNVFNIKNVFNGTKIEKSKTSNGIITKMNGKNISLPEEFTKLNVSILNNDSIVEYVKNEENSNSNVKYEITVETQKNADEVFNEYIQKYSNPMTYETNDTKTIITGNAENLIKIIISNNKYVIKIEKR